MERVNWERWSAILLTFSLGTALAYCALRFAFPILLPFLLAWLIAWMLRPLSQKLSRVSRLPQPLCAALLLVATVGLGAWGIVTAVWRLLSELGGLVNRLLSDGGLTDALGAAGTWLEALSERWGIETPNGALRQKLYEMAGDMVGSLLSAIASGLPELVARLLSSLPTVLFVIVLTVIAGYYFCVDWERVCGAIRTLVPARWHQRMRAVRLRGRGLFARYIKAYLWLLLITFSLLLAGLLILGVDYAFLLSLLIAVLDLLPVLGVGTVLLPWSVVMLIGRHFYVGFGLILLYLIITLVRQALEPRLLGKSLGLHPIVMLFATYAGFSLFGIIGMILGPVVAIPIKYALDVLLKKEKRGEG